MVSILISSPEWRDLASRFGRFHTRKLIAYLTDKGYNVIDLGPEFTQQDILNNIKDVDGWYGFGHGSSKIFTGYKMETIIDQNNYKKFNGPIKHFLSCSFMKSTGKKMDNTSGYQVIYYFAISSQDPEKETKSKYYFDSDQAYFKALTDDKTREEALDIAKTAYFDAYKELKESGNEYYGQWLLYDGANLVQTEDISLKLPRPNGEPQPEQMILEHDIGNGWEYVGEFKNQYMEFYFITYIPSRIGMIFLRAKMGDQTDVTNITVKDSKIWFDNPMHMRHYPINEPIEISVRLVE